MRKVLLGLEVELLITLATNFHGSCKYRSLIEKLEDFMKALQTGSQYILVFSGPGVP